MNILFITETFPYPLDSGGKIVSYQVLQMLSKQHSVHLLTLAGKPPAASSIRSIRSLGIEVNVILSKKRSEWYKQSKLEMFAALICLRPFYLSLFDEQQFKKTLSRLLMHQKFDVIHVDHVGMTQYFPKEKNLLWVLSTQNVEYKLSEGLSQSPDIPIKEKLFHLYNAMTLARYERNILRRVDQIIVLSQKEKEELTSIGINPGKIMITPPFYTVTRYRKLRHRRELLFIGNLWWKPNFDAIAWFIQDIFPLLHQEDPSITLTIVGDGAGLLSPVIKQQAAIRAIGKKTNIEQYLNRATVFVMPFRIGGGVRIKALTAFAHSVPIVSTSVGMRGIEAVPGTHYLRADSPATFASQVIKLMRNPLLRIRFAGNAGLFLREHHARATTQRLFLKIYGQPEH